MGVGEDPEPGRPAADLPPGLIDVLHRTLPRGLDQCGVAGPGPPGQPLTAPHQRRRGDDQPGEGRQHRGALAERGADAVLQVRREPQEPRAELHGGGPQGVGGLLGVTPLDPPETRRAPRHRDAEAGDDRLGLGEVDLVLVVDGDRGVVERRVTLGALGRQRDLDGAIHLFGRRPRPMAGRVPELAPRSLGLGLGRPLGEGCGLALTGPLGLLQFGLEPLHLGAEFLDQSGLPPILIEEFVVGGGRGVHDEVFTRPEVRNATG